MLQRGGVRERLADALCGSLGLEGRAAAQVRAMMRDGRAGGQRPAVGRVAADLASCLFATTETTGAAAHIKHNPLHTQLIKRPRAHARTQTQLRKAERAALVEALTAHPLDVTGHEGYKKAEVTGGGVPLGEIDCRTCESRVSRY